MANTVCEERERLWQCWIDACALLEDGEIELESSLVAEQGTRHLLNAHMVSHGCGLPVSDPKLDE
jgi:hypothetical protein